MNKNSMYRLKQFLQHLFLWIVVLMFFVFVFDVDNTINTNVLYFSLFLMPVTIAITYTSIYLLIPNYLVTKRYLRFALYSLYTLIVSVFSICLSIFFALAYLTDFKFDKVNTIGRSALFIITSIFLVVIIVSAFKLLKLNLKQSKKNAELQSKILATQLKLKEQELKYLKMQIHPHFLFNTLNTLYGFAIKKADETSEMILKLSNLLDYLLYQVDRPFVNLTDEIHHIEDYISLEQMRFSDTLNVSFRKKTHSESIEIAPMLLIPFVENSFKHGAIVNGKLDIDISIETKPKIVAFKIKNSKAKDSKINDGIGLENIRKRLELLYPNQHILNISNEESSFLVDLQLTLNSNLTND
jgi:two-component system, LytTR family, sensor kinase